MEAAAMHWAAGLIGRPYRRGADGPEAFSCWGLVRHVFRVRWGIEMPHVEVGGPWDPAQQGNLSAIQEAARVSGWRPVGDRVPVDGDIALMHGLDGPHVGVMIEVDGRVVLLHAHERAGVCTQTLADAALHGLAGAAFWRRAP